jgi:hypothetical protein
MGVDRLRHVHVQILKGIGVLTVHILLVLKEFGVVRWFCFLCALWPE